MFNNIDVRGTGKIGGKTSDFQRLITTLNTASREGRLPKGLEQILALPNSICISTSYFDMVIESLPEDIRAEINKAESGQDYSYDLILRGMTHAPLPPQLQHELELILKVMTMPLAVRTSSIYEDRADAQLSGAYHSRFIQNSGTDEERLEQLAKAVKMVFAGTYMHDPISRRKAYGLLESPDKMAVLIQNLIGERYNDLLMPLVSGVIVTNNGRSLWSETTREDGRIELVFGHPQAVVDGEGSSRILSFARSMRGYRMHHPEVCRVERSTQDIVQAQQRYVRAYNTKTSDMDRVPIIELIVSNDVHFPDADKLVAFGITDQRIEQRFDKWEMARGGIMYPDFFLIDKLPCGLSLMDIMREFSLIAREALGGKHADIEFAVSGGKFYPLQVRDLSYRREHNPVPLPRYVQEDQARHVIIELGKRIPNGKVEGIEYIVYVDREEYLKLSPTDKHAVARAIGMVNSKLGELGKKFILVGPNRWGNQDATEGIPVYAGDILNAAAIIGYSKLDGQDGATYDFAGSSHFFIAADGRGIIDIPADPAGERTIFRDDVLDINNGAYLFDGIDDRVNEAVRRALKILDVRDAYNTTAALALDSENNRGALYLTKADGYNILSFRERPERRERATTGLMISN